MPEAEAKQTWAAPDGARFGFREWLPETDSARAMVVALHGLGCRAEDFEPLAIELSRRGIGLAAWNLRGQGIDPAVKRRGAWLEIDGMLADLKAFVEERCGANQPVFLCGDSMGALLAVQAARKPEWEKRIAGLLLFVPVVGLAQKNPPAVKKLIRILAGVLPDLRLRPGWFVHGSASMPPLTRIPERQQELLTAPHRLGPLTMRFLIRMSDLIESSAEAAGEVRVPTAVFSAGHDVFVSTEQIGDFFNRLGAADKARFHYPDSYHQLLFDFDAAQVVVDAARWIEERIPTNTSNR